MADAKQTIENGKAVLGIEFGSTRIKAVLVDDKNAPIASGSHEWNGNSALLIASPTHMSPTATMSDA